MHSRIAMDFATAILISTLLLLAGCIDSDKAVLSSQYSSDLDLKPGNFIVCLSRGGYEELIKTNECGSSRLAISKTGELVGALPAKENSPPKYLSIAAKHIESNLYLLQLTPYESAKEDVNSFYPLPGRKPFYGFLLYNQSEKVWHFFIPATDKKLKIDLGRIAHFKDDDRLNMNIVNPSVENLSQIMKIISTRKENQFLLAGRVSPQN